MPGSLRIPSGLIAGPGAERASAPRSEILADALRGLPLGGNNIMSLTIRGEAVSAHPCSCGAVQSWPGVCGSCGANVS
jgi:hypothetical protein